MLQAYNTLLKELEARQEGELKPEKKIEEKKNREAVQVAESLTTEGVGKEIANLKLEIGRTLTGISDQLEGEVSRFVAIRNAIGAKEKELAELYEIEKSAMSLAALIEAQNQKRQEFTAEMEEKKESLRQGRISRPPAPRRKKSRTSMTPPSRSATQRRRRGRPGKRRSSTTPSSGSSRPPPTGSPTRRRNWRRSSRIKRNRWSRS